MAAIRSRQLKKDLIRLFRQKDFCTVLKAVANLPPAKAVSPLCGLFHHPEELVRWRAVAALGAVTAQMAAEAMEPARVVMRRLMWNLNEESGGIGWGSPEAMGEITARHDGLAREYHRVLCAYAIPGGTFIEFAPLQRGVLWGIGRLARVRPALTAPASKAVVSFFEAEDSLVRGHAAWAAGGLDPAAVAGPLEGLTRDAASLTTFIDGKLVDVTVGELASGSLALIEKRDGSPPAALS